ncbi:T-cell surface glycoprotein CD8 beta chain isoform X2 [Cavia porcellus]|uniref:T-cell surface glycoprotein CD8 beta chain isoform X2 n=1 Tax=Cavia porcellus TaxID=10141 RepID=UPI002FDFFFC8
MQPRLWLLVAAKLAALRGICGLQQSPHFLMLQTNQSATMTCESKTSSINGRLYWLRQRGAPSPDSHHEFLASGDFSNNIVYGRVDVLPTTAQPTTKTTPKKKKCQPPSPGPQKGLHCSLVTLGLLVASALLLLLSLVVAVHLYCLRRRARLRFIKQKCSISWPGNRWSHSSLLIPGSTNEQRQCFWWPATKSHRSGMSNIWTKEKERDTLKGGNFTAVRKLPASNCCKFFLGASRWSPGVSTLRVLVRRLQSPRAPHKACCRTRNLHQRYHLRLLCSSQAGLGLGVGHAATIFALL